jgi:hypothetical protein
MSGRKVFTAGSVLTAADVNDYLMDQAVMVFGGSAARGSAIGTATEGMTSYLTDTNKVEVFDGTNWAALNNLESQVIDTKSASYTAVAGDNGKIIQFTSGPATFTFSTAIPIGGRVDITTNSTAVITIAGGAGSTLQSYLGYNKLAGQHAWASIVRINAGTAGLVGNIGA